MIEPSDEFIQVNESTVATQDGLAFYVVDENGAVVSKWQLSAAWDLSTHTQHPACVLAEHEKNRVLQWCKNKEIEC